jgi:hypothetical protein
VSEQFAFAVTPDVTNQINVSDPQSVLAAVRDILEKRYPGQRFRGLDAIFRDVARLYQGEFPGFRACETEYHNLQHVLDVTLAAARLVDGYEQENAEQPLGHEMAFLAVIVALFHDSGYIRRQNDSKRKHGAEYTRTHVSRSGQFMSDYLPTVGLGRFVDIASELVHFTGYEVATSDIKLSDPRHVIVGALVGTADVIAQLADREYLAKCEHLYEEFRIGGIDKVTDDAGETVVIYASADELLQKTPQFMRTIIEERLEGLFSSYYRYAAVHFGGDNLYMQALSDNLNNLERLIQISEGEVGRYRHLM